MLQRRKQSPVSSAWRWGSGSLRCLFWWLGEREVVTKWISKNAWNKFPLLCYPAARVVKNSSTYSLGPLQSWRWVVNGADSLWKLKRVTVENNRRKGRPVEWKLILSEVDKRFNLSKSHSSRKCSWKVFIRAVIECEIAAVPFKTQYLSSGL